jgi:hypothetical protein
MGTDSSALVSHRGAQLGQEIYVYLLRAWLDCSILNLRRVQYETVCADLTVVTASFTVVINDSVHALQDALSPLKPKAYLNNI